MGGGPCGFGPGLKVGATQLSVAQGPKDVQTVAGVMRDYGRDRTIGHSGSIQPASRLQEDVRGPDGVLYEKGLPIPTIITVYSDRSFTFIMKTPPASVLIRKAIGIEKGSGTPNTSKVGKITRKQLEEIAKTKQPDLTAAEHDLTGPVNIGHGQETTVLDLIEALNDVSDNGPLPAPVFAAERPGEVRRSCLDVTRARTELGWEPRTSLREGLARILATF